MSQEWYVYKDRQQLGPYTWEKLWQQARSGAILPGDQIWNRQMEGWQRAEQIPGLVHGPASATAPPPPPAARPASGGEARRETPAKEGTKAAFVAVIMVLVLLVGGGGGAAYYFLFRDRGLPAADIEPEIKQQVLPGQTGSGDPGNDQDNEEGQTEKMPEAPPEPAAGETQSAFWQLNPAATEFTVYQHGGYKLVVELDHPDADINAHFRVAYFREDDGSVAYNQEMTDVITAGHGRLTLDSDWTGFDLSQMGFKPGKHRVVAYIDSIEIASGELIVK